MTFYYAKVNIIHEEEAFIWEQQKVLMVLQDDQDKRMIFQNIIQPLQFVGLCANDHLKMIRRIGEFFLE